MGRNTARRLDEVCSFLFAGGLNGFIMEYVGIVCRGTGLMASPFNGQDEHP